MHARAFQANTDQHPAVLAGKRSSWVEAVRITVTNDRGETQNWSFRLARTPPDKVSLDSQTTAEVVWSMGPEQTAKLPEGRYELIAEFDTRRTAAPGSWTGVVRSEPASVSIAAEPAPLSPEQRSDKHLLFASHYLINGDMKRALSEVDQLVAEQPDNVGGLALRADVLAGLGKHREALDNYGGAIRAYRKLYGSREPPHSPLRKQGELYERLSRQPPPSQTFAEDVTGKHHDADPAGRPFNAPVAPVGEREGVPRPPNKVVIGRRAVKVLKPAIEFPACQEIQLQTTDGLAHATVAQGKLGEEIRVPSSSQAYQVVWVPAEGKPVVMIKGLILSERKVVELRPEDHLGMIRVNGEEMPRKQIRARGNSGAAMATLQECQKFGQIMVVPAGTYSVSIDNRTIDGNLKVQAGKLHDLK